jgi:glycosyltransferase involved in cell wall biosynthesis
MKILLVTETLHTGGAETFVVRLANALAKEHEVMVVNIYPHLSKPALMTQFLPGVQVVHLRIPLRLLRQKLAGAMIRLGIDQHPLDKKIISLLDSLLASFKPDVVHSHLFKPDYYCAEPKARHSFRHITTIHGDYLVYDQDCPAYLLKYAVKRNRILSHLDALVVISDDQLQWYRRLIAHLNYPSKVHKILNGYEAPAFKPRDRAALGIPQDALVFGMVSRGIPEKGWCHLIEAFVKNEFPDAYLLLVGEGAELDRLRSLYVHNKKIVFAGYAERPIEYISLFDIGVLPSVYKAESLPTVIIEYLYCGKPVIATEVGEIRNMIACTDGTLAGDLVACPDFVIDQASLELLLHRYYSDNAYLETRKANTAAAFRKFDMDNCVQQYLAIYASGDK